MQRKPKTPRQIAEEMDPKVKRSISVSKRYLDVLEDLAKMEDIPISNLIDEAIKYYLEAIRDETPPTNVRKK